MSTVYRRKINKRFWGIFFVIISSISLTASFYFSVQPTFLLNLLPLLLLYYNYSKERYCIQENGTLKITTIWRSRVILSGISKVTYRPNHWTDQKIKIDYAQGFTLINPEHPERFISDLKAVNKELIVIKNS